MNYITLLFLVTLIVLGGPTPLFSVPFFLLAMYLALTPNEKHKALGKMETFSDD